MELLPYSDSRFPTSHLLQKLISENTAGSTAPFYHRMSQRYFWDSDVDNISQRLRVYQEAVHKRKPGAKPALKSFKEDCIREAKRVMEVRLFALFSVF